MPLDPFLSQTNPVYIFKLVRSCQSKCPCPFVTIHNIPILSYDEAFLVPIPNPQAGKPPNRITKNYWTELLQRAQTQRKGR